MNPMVWLQNRWRRLKRETHEIRYLPTGQPLGHPDGEGTVYQVNPVYLEIGQGANSPIRGLGAVVFLAILYLVGRFLAYAPEFISDLAGGDLDPVVSVFIIASYFTIIPLAGLISIYYLWTAFFGVTDALVRFDRKRQKVWLWDGKQPIELDWNKLVPRADTRIVNQFGGKVTIGEYVELGPDGEVKKTGKRPHIVQCGPAMGAVVNGYPYMEFVRRYMEAPNHAAVPYVKKFLAHRPKWWAMVNFVGLAEDWSDWHRDRDKPGVSPAPWGTTILWGLFFPIWFPLQFSNWLALRVAPIPKWPKELEAMHAADLAELEGRETVAAGIKDSPARRKPVIRVNGQIVDS